MRCACVFSAGNCGVHERADQFQFALDCECQDVANPSQCHSNSLRGGPLIGTRRQMRLPSYLVRSCDALSIPDVPILLTVPRLYSPRPATPPTLSRLWDSIVTLFSWL